MSSRRRSAIADGLVLLPWGESVALAGIAYVVLPAVLPSPVAKSGLVGIVCRGLLVPAATCKGFD